MWYVVVIDLAWGRKEYLWETLLAPPRAGYSWRPDPDLPLEVEFVGAVLVEPATATRETLNARLCSSMDHVVVARR